MDENEGKNDMLQFIAATVETLRDRVETLRDRVGTMGDQMATMGDQMATMGDQMATMGDRMATMGDQMATMGNQMATMGDQMATMGDQMATMGDRMATKSELRRLEDKMEAGFTAVRGDIERVALRLDTIERALSARLSQIETEVSRLRSVLYLLVKDQPELLRLLGTEPPLV